MKAWTQTIFLVLGTSTTFAQTPPQIAARVRAIQSNHPPQIRDASRLFDQAHAHEGNFEGTILCRVSADSSRRYDGAAPRGPISRRYGAPDLNVTLRVHRTRGFVHGPEDRYSTTVSMPDVSVRRRQRIGIHLVDRDALRNDTIGDAVAVYGGSFPIELPGNQANGECRVLDPAIAEQRIPDIVRRADRELQRAASVQVDLNASEIATPREPLDRALYHLYDAAALAGWQHAEVGNRRERVTEIQRVYTEALSEAIEEVKRRIPAAGQPVAFSNDRWEARVTQVDCNARDMSRFGTTLETNDPRGCAVRLEVATSRAARFRPQVRALTSRGELTRAVIGIRERNDAYERYSGQRLETGELHVLWVLTGANPDLLRLQIGSETVFIRAR